MHKPALPQKKRELPAWCRRCFRACAASAACSLPGNSSPTLSSSPCPLSLPPFPADGWRRAACGLRRLPSLLHLCTSCGREGCQLQLQSASILEVSEFSRRSSRRQRAVGRSVTLPGGPGRFTASASLLLLSSRCRPSASPRGDWEGREIKFSAFPSPDESESTAPSQHHTHHTHLKPTANISGHQARQLLGPQSDAVLVFFFFERYCAGTKGPSITCNQQAGQVACEAQLRDGRGSAPPSVGVVFLL